VFEPFFTTKGLGKGTGLGLSTVFAVVRRLGGQVRVDSELGRGTTVTLFFPVTEWAPPALDALAPPAPGDETVLVVEDDALVRATVQAYLETLGYRVLGAANAEEAVRATEGAEQRIDLVVSDVMMPGRLGGDLARELRERRPDLRILFMSAHSRDELARLGRIEPGAPFLEKPFAQAELGRAARAILGGPPPAEAGGTSAPAEAHSEITLVERRARRRLLVVDDNADLAESLQEGLELEGHEVAVAYTGAEALRIARTLRPHAVLCDLELGEAMSGYEVARSLRREEPVRALFLVAFTGFEAASCRSAALAAGFDAVVTKPVGLEQIEQLLAAAGSDTPHMQP
jgi:CheY-like chemotaxis protein